MQEKSLRKTFTVKVANQGNARSRYEVWVEDAAHVLTFDLSLNGVGLGTATKGAPQPATQNTGSPSPASARASASASASASVSQAASTASGAVQSANGFTNFIGEILDTLGNILPGGAGQSLLNMSANIRRGQASVQRVQRVEQRAEGVSNQFQGYASKVQGAGNSKTPSASGSTSSSTLAAATADSDPLVSITRPQTPYVEPGSQVELGMLIRPLTRLKEERAPFTVSSRSLEEPDAQPVTQSGTALFTGMTGIRFYLPYAIVAGVALLLIVLLLVATRAFG
jgi:hypothetical protein